MPGRFWTRSRFQGSLVVVGVAGSLVGAALFLTWLQNGPPRLGSAAHAETLPNRLPRIRVIDGDTVKIGADTVRLSNVDAPELPPGAECWAEARMAWAAKEHLERLLDEEAVARVDVVPDGRERDRYGRRLGRVVVNSEMDVGADLMAWGLAAPWTGRRWDWCGPVTADPNGAGLVADPRDSVVKAYGPGAEAYRP